MALVKQVRADLTIMTQIINPPKDSLKLLAENMAQFEAIRDNWIRGGNLLYADFTNGLYEAAGLFSGKLAFCQFSEPEKEEIVEAPPDPADLNAADSAD